MQSYIEFHLLTTLIRQYPPDESVLKCFPFPPQTHCYDTSYKHLLISLVDNNYPILLHHQSMYTLRSRKIRQLTSSPLHPLHLCIWNFALLFEIASLFSLVEEWGIRGTWIVSVVRCRLLLLLACLLAGCNAKQWRERVEREMKSIRFIRTWPCGICSPPHSTRSSTKMAAITTRNMYVCVGWRCR